MGGPAEKIKVSIVDANGTSLSSEPLSFKSDPSKTGAAIMELIAIAYGSGLLLDVDGDAVTRTEQVKAGNYEYRVTGSANLGGAPGSAIRGGALGLGPGSNAGPRPLSVTAPQLQRLTLPEGVSQPPQDVSLFKLASNEHDAAGTFPPYFVDSSDVVGKLNSWLRVLQKNYSAALELTEYTKSSPPLFIHGFIKSGKTLTLTGMLPAVLRRHPFFGVGGKAEMVHCHLDFSAITTQGEATYRERLEELLCALEMWAAGGAAAPARPERPATVRELESAIPLFFKNLGRPVLYTVDELQSWFILPPGERDLLNRARAFIKIIFCKMPRSAALAVTGSSMCLVWSNVASMPPNGVALVAHNRTLTLPAVDTAGAEVAWAYLCTTCKSSGWAVRWALPPDLYKLYSAPHPAMLTYLCEEYVNSGAEEYANDVSRMFEFVQVHEHDKVMFEMSKDFGAVLQQASVDTRKLLYSLAAGNGVLLGALRNRGLYYMLKDLVERVDERGTVRLKSVYHRALIKILANSEGEMQTASLWTERLPPLMLYEAYMALLLFGNMIAKAGRDTWRSYSVLRDYLQHLADTCPAFTDNDLKDVLGHPDNAQAARNWGGKDISSMPRWEKVALYHRLLCNALAHVCAPLSDDDLELLPVESSALPAALDELDKLLEGGKLQPTAADTVLLRGYPFMPIHQIPEVLMLQSVKGHTLTNTAASGVSTAGSTAAAASGSDLNTGSLGNSGGGVGGSGSGGSVCAIMPCHSQQSRAAAHARPPIPLSGWRYSIRHSCVVRPPRLQRAAVPLRGKIV